MNNYRNWKFHFSNALKIQFKAEADIPVLDAPIDTPVRITYTFYYPDNRLRDIDNSLAVISKFCGDAMVENGVLNDDNYKWVKSVKGVYGGIDNVNPRCDVEIKEAK